ncbi:cytidine deaminase [Schaalia sp. Marseille-Q2122]|uniref:cytidine deaminase n=1 Tax=Schaalia sp. Marseille-Q2122 TaxID=2736604 RepID=UPI00158CD566|nr:cytidine deaminase [Schaalia sp. Marseille-Q2122]
MTDTTIGTCAGTEGLVIDEALWARLREAANAAAARAYAPYSKYHVGAAALVNDGRIVTGCNVENAGLGVTLCAECGLISDLVNGGGGRLVAFLCVNGEGDIISPCGRCRQILFEHGGTSLVLTMPQGVMTMNEVLPGAFGPSDLDSM